MMFDTDVLIFVQKGNTKAARLIDQTEERKISVQTILELLQSARNKEQHRVIQKFITDFGFSILPYYREYRTQGYGLYRRIWSLFGIKGWRCNCSCDSFGKQGAALYSKYEALQEH